uniref:Putative secreted protein n=1 Tax=Anopheles darlingi TaxID=43151 RepID=A0A2M4D676_ANODA
MSCGPFAVLSCHFISPLVTLSLSLSLSLTLALPLFLPYTRPREGSLTHFGIAYRWSSPFLLLCTATIRPQDIITISIIAISSSPLIRSELGVRVESLFTYHYSRSREAQI